MPQPRALPIVTADQIAREVMANQQAIAEEVKKQAAQVTDDPLRQAQLTNSFADVAGVLQQHANGQKVMATAPHAMASVLQSFVVQKAAEAGQVDTHEDAVPIVKFSDGDLLEYIKTGLLACSKVRTSSPGELRPTIPTR